MKINSIGFFSGFRVQNFNISTKIPFYVRKNACSKTFQQALSICRETKRQIYICQNGIALGVVIYRELQSIVGFGWVLIYSLTSATPGMADDPQVWQWSTLTSSSRRASFLQGTLATPH